MKPAKRRLPPPPKKSSPVPIIAGCVGGVVLLIIIIAVASGGRQAAPPRRVESAPPPAEAARKTEDTGPIMFICANSPKHEDKEVVFTQCPNCPAAGRFYWDHDRYRCLKCSQAFDNKAVKCPECGKVPAKARIKHTGR